MRPFLVGVLAVGATACGASPKCDHEVAISASAEQVSLGEIVDIHATYQGTHCDAFALQLSWPEDGTFLFVNSTPTVSTVGQAMFFDNAEVVDASFRCEKAGTSVFEAVVEGPDQTYDAKHVDVACVDPGGTGPTDTGDPGGDLTDPADDCAADICYAPGPCTHTEVDFRTASVDCTGGVYEVTLTTTGGLVDPTTDDLTVSCSFRDQPGAATQYLSISCHASAASSGAFVASATMNPGYAPYPTGPDDGCWIENGNAVFRATAANLGFPATDLSCTATHYTPGAYVRESDWFQGIPLPTCTI